MKPDDPALRRFWRALPATRSYSGAAAALRELGIDVQPEDLARALGTPGSGRQRRVAQERIDEVAKEVVAGSLPIATTARERGVPRDALAAAVRELRQYMACPFCKGKGTAFAFDAIDAAGHLINPRREPCDICGGDGRKQKMTPPS